MTIKKKTLYEVLEVPTNASDSEIQAAHQRLSQKLQSEKTGFNHEDIAFKLKVIDVAFHTLSSPRIRDAYDARLAALNAPANLTVPSNVVAFPAKVDALSIKADAVSLKADAVALKADALSLRADVMSLMVTDAPLRSEGGHKSPLSIFFAMFSSLAAPLKKTLLFVASFIAAGMVIQVLFMLLVNRQAEHVTDEVSKAEEKMIIQEYYQEHGVRPGSKIEADLLEVENRRKENEQREMELEKQREEEKNRRFVEESRQLGQQVSADLRREEERVRYEEEQKRQQLEQEKRDQEEAERNRIEEERNRIEEERIHRESEMRRLGLN